MMKETKHIIWLIFLGILATVKLHAQDFYITDKPDFNTEYKELAPAFYQDGIVFCSDRKSTWFISYTDMRGNQLTNLYFSAKRNEDKFDKPVLFSDELSTKLFEGPASFSRDGKTVFFTRSKEVGSVRNRFRNDSTFGIFISKLENDKWSDPEAFTHNYPGFNTAYPFLTDDGLCLYFCSDRPDGYGGFDIYMSVLENEQWSTPVNLGKTINTRGNDIFPFIDNYGVLYFSSRGHKESTDLDIFYSENLSGGWGSPVPLSGAFNTDFDDYGLIWNSALDTGYFVSDRDGSADIFLVNSTIPVFRNCNYQEENDYCYIFYEANNSEVDTSTFAYEWDLGDGTKSRSLHVEHCYAAAGTYEVNLNVIDKLTGEAYFSEASYVLNLEEIVQPYISAPDTVFAGESVKLNGHKSYLKDIDVEEYYWDFGDRNRDLSIEVNHVFTEPGIFQLQLGAIGTSMETGIAGEKRCVTKRIVVLQQP